VAAAAAFNYTFRGDTEEFPACRRSATQQTW
jgi:hypothetical protein